MKINKYVLYKISWNRYFGSAGGEAMSIYYLNNIIKNYQLLINFSSSSQYFTHYSFMSKTLKTGWHVLYVRSCQERKVYQLLQENQLESFLPMVNIVKQWSDRKKTISKPLFPSYVFVNINSSLEFHKALSVNGACNYIRFGNECALTTEKEIRQIKFLVGQSDISDIEINTQLPKIGETKKITYGLLNGLYCEIDKVNNHNKIIVRIDSLQQNIVATIPSYFLDEVL